MDRVLIVANGAPPSSQLLHSLLATHPYLVAVDGGAYACLEAGFTPHLITGDFDSLNESVRRDLCKIPQLFTPDQNKTDLEKTLEYLFERGAKHITVCGALGKRLDHTLTNVCLLTRYPARVKFETDDEVCFAIEKSITFSCFPGQILSMIPFRSPVTGLQTEGLKWELKGETLRHDQFSLSNVSLQSEISISFVTGELLVCLNK